FLFQQRGELRLPPDQDDVRVGRLGGSDRPLHLAVRGIVATHRIDGDLYHGGKPKKGPGSFRREPRRFRFPLRPPSPGAPCNTRIWGTPGEAASVRGIAGIRPASPAARNHAPVAYPAGPWNVSVLDLA